MSLNICFVASEVAPLAKTGGLADVAGALPHHLLQRGHDIRLFMPLYSSIDRQRLNCVAIDHARDIQVRFRDQTYSYSLLASQLPNGVPLYLVDCPQAYARNSLYTSDADEHRRFLILQRAALDGCQRLGFAPDIIHCNDWHAALLPLLLKTSYTWDRLFSGTRTLLSIHNIGYQGQFPLDTLDDVAPQLHSQVAGESLNVGLVNWLREGIRHASAVSTVSPTYAREICTPQGGYGLHEALLARGDAITGILNGVDYEEWNPATDRHLEHRFDAQHLQGKRATKQALLHRLRLPAGDLPLLGIVSRLTVQKGFDLLQPVLPELLAKRQFALVALGSGEARYEGFFSDLQRRFPEQVVFHRGYHEELAHLIEAAADIFLMPSLYEPCGLNQMYSLKYGTIPIVRRTGGLADSVQMWDAGTAQGTGIVFNDYDAAAARWAIETALTLFQDPVSWQRLMRNAMAQDFSWTRQSELYEALYRQMLAQD